MNLDLSPRKWSSSEAGQLKLAAVEGLSILPLRIVALESKMQAITLELAFAAEASAVRRIPDITPMVATIFLDESGYTGDDLFDPHQPVFAIATHSFTGDQCSSFAREYFGHLVAGELKHVALQRRANHQKAVLSLLARAFAEPDRLSITVAHKRFALTLKLVDILVEPIAHRAGFDIYRNGFFRSFGNTLFFALQTEGSTVLDELLRAFQAMVRRRTGIYFDEFVRISNRPALLDVIDETLEHVRSHVRLTSLSDIAELPPKVLDISSTMALQCMYKWRARNVGPMELMHDRSSNMARQRNVWDAIVSTTAPAAIVGYGSSAVEFPLGVASTSFVDSATSYGVQLADVFAGATARWGRWMAHGMPASDAYGVELDKLFSNADQQIFATVMWPVPDVSRNDTNPEFGDFLDYLTARVSDAEGNGDDQTA